MSVARKKIHQSCLNTYITPTALNPRAGIHLIEELRFCKISSIGIDPFICNVNGIVAMYTKRRLLDILVVSRDVVFLASGIVLQPTLSILCSGTTRPSD